ncbi:MAG TPA: ethanolamine permease [Actinomycetota bacterium]
MEEKPRVEKVGVVEYEHVGRQYMEHRALERRAGVALIWGLGVGYVISGEYFSWNFGFAGGGFGGFLIASVLAVAMYVFMVYSISEMATAFPVTGGPYAFARRTMGVWGGFATGIGAILEYVFATSAIAAAIFANIAILPPFNDLPNVLGLQPIEWVAAITFAIFVVINLTGVQATLVSVFAITVTSVVVLLLWGTVLLIGGHWDASNFTNIAPAAGQSTLFPFGAFKGILQALPFAFWFFLAIEGVPLASEETRDPSRDLPRGSILAMWSLVFFAAVAFFVGGGVLGAEGLSGAGAPLAESVKAAHGGESNFFWIVAVVGITGLVASFHSIIFAFSRIIYALSRAGYLPRFLSLTGRRKSPYLAIVIPAFLALLTLIITNRQSDPVNAILIVTEMSVFGALTTYVLMMLSFIILRVKEPNVQRPYRSPVGIVGAVIAAIIAFVAGVAQLGYNLQGARTGVLVTIGVLLAGYIYFWLYSRHRLVAEAPEEEFALIERAEAELDAPV